MKKRTLFKLAAGICLVLMLALIPLISACSKEAPATTVPATTAPATTAPATTAPTTAAPIPAPAPIKPIVIRAHSFNPLTDKNMHFLPEFIKRANDRSKGQLVIKYIGGPEVVSMNDQFEAMRSGVIDFALSAVSFYLAAVPEGRAIYVSEYTPTEERARGFNAFMDKMHKEKANLHYMGRANAVKFYIWPAKKQVAKPQDVAGLRVRAMIHCDPLIKALGGIPVTIKTVEAYSALERGVCNAFAGDVFVVQDLKLWEVVKYVTYPACFDKTAADFVINLNTWNKLPKNLQDIMTQIETEFDQDIPAWTVEQERLAMEQAKAGGMQVVEFSAEDAKFYTDLAKSSTWTEVQKLVSPENYNKLRELIMK